jgi:hypothetical protein
MSIPVQQRLQRSRVRNSVHFPYFEIDIYTVDSIGNQKSKMVCAILSFRRVQRGEILSTPRKKFPPAPAGGASVAGAGQQPLTFGSE